MKKPQICIPIVAESESLALESIARARPLADLIELRLDALVGEYSLPRLLAAAAGRPVVATCRGPEEGGWSRAPAARRRAVLQEAIDAGVAFVDAEAAVRPGLNRHGPTRLILSRHWLDGPPPDLEGAWRELAQAGPDLVKLAFKAADIRDNLRLFSLLERADRPTVGVAMGESGLISRVLACRQGGEWTYASLAAGRESAPGQLTAAELLERYRFRQLDGETELYGVLANPVGHSLSPAIHNAAFAAAGLNACYLPLLARDVGGLLAALKPFGWRGFSVTIPHKEAVRRELDGEAEPARLAGAVNTVTLRENGWQGTNTDLEAVVASARSLLAPLGRSLAGARAVLVGAGGSARATGIGLKRAGAELTVVNRTVERGERLARELGAAFLPLERAAEAAGDLLVNTTPLGMAGHRPDALPVPAAMLRPDLAVLDIIYNPLATPLVKAARDRGAPAAGGLDMFLAQGAAQWREWTGRTPPLAAMKQAAIDRLGADAV